MTSDRALLLKEAMRCRVEQSHQRFLAARLGPCHPAAEQQKLRATQAIVSADGLRAAAEADCVLAVWEKQREALARVCRVGKPLASADVDSVLDALAELKSSVEDVKDSLVLAAAERAEESGLA